MFKIIQFDNCNNNKLQYFNSDKTMNKFDWYQLKNDPILESENFEKTLIGYGSTNFLDLEKRSSWTHKLKFYLTMPEEAIIFFEQNNISYEENNDFSLLKYETGDFFFNHHDTKLPTQSGETHEYTCLIFCPYGENNDILEGGELIFKHPESLYEIKFDSSVETKKNHFVMIIFSIDMYHEVLPIISGTRWLFKKPLFVERIFDFNYDNNSLPSHESYGDEG